MANRKFTHVGESSRALETVKEQARKLHATLEKISKQPNRNGQTTVDFLRSQDYKDLLNYSLEIVNAKDGGAATGSFHKLVHIWYGSDIKKHEKLLVSGINKDIFNAISSEISILETAIPDIQSAIEENVENYIENERQKTIEMIAAFRNQTSESFTEIGTSIAAAKSDIAKLNSAMAGEFRKSAALFDTAKSSIEEKERELDTLIGTITPRGLNAGYSAIADKEAEIANMLRSIAFVVMLAVSIFAAVIVVATFFIHNLGIGEAVLKAVGLLVISAPAVYLARESSRHRDTANHFQQTALDVAGAPPYLREQETPQRNKILGELAHKLFNRTRPNIKHNNDTVADLKEILLKLIEKLPSN